MRSFAETLSARLGLWVFALYGAAVGLVGIDALTVLVLGAEFS
jgi:hypothetical protein